MKQITPDTIRPSLRRMVKTSLAIGLYSSGMDRLVGTLRGRHDAPLVLGYHKVVDNFEENATETMPSMLISTRTFARQLEWIARHYEIVSLDDLSGVLTGTRKQSKPVAAITFDDGYQDFYHLAFPILQRMGLPSAVFVVSNLVGTTDLLAHDELYLQFSALKNSDGTLYNDIPKSIVTSLNLTAGVKKTLLNEINAAKTTFQLTRVLLENLSHSELHCFIRNIKQQVHISHCKEQKYHLMDWEMLKYLVNHGVTIGSHTRSHALLDNEPAVFVRGELQGSRQILEQGLNVPVRHLAYPDGRFNACVLQEAAAAGYQTAYTICDHQYSRQPLLTISRNMLWEKSCMDYQDKFSPAILSCQINGIFDPASKCRLPHGSVPTPV